MVSLFRIGRPRLISLEGVATSEDPGKPSEGRMLENERSWDDTNDIKLRLQTGLEDTRRREKPTVIVMVNVSGQHVTGSMPFIVVSCLW